MKRLFLFLASVAFTLTFTAQNSVLKQADEAYQKGDFEQAAMKYEQIVKTAEKSSKPPTFEINLIYARLGESFLRIKQYSKAEIYFTKTYDRGTRGTDFLINYGEALLGIDKTEKATNVFQQVLATDPNNSKALNRLNSVEFNTNSKNDPKSKTNPVTLEKKLNTRNNNHFALAWLQGSLLFSSDRKDAKGSTKPASERFFTAQPLQGDWGPIKKIVTPKSKTFPNDNSFAFDKETSTAYSARCRNTAKGLNCNIYASQVDAKNKFKRAMPQSFHDDNADIRQPTLSSDGKVMIYARNDGKKYDLYIVKKLGNNIWTTPQKLGDDVNTNGDECYPQLFQDSILFFASNGHQGMGGMDIFYTKITIDGVGHAFSEESDLSRLEFSMPINLEAPINSGADDFALLMNSSGKGGYFLSNRVAMPERNKNDIYSFPQAPYTFDELGAGTLNMLAKAGTPVTTPPSTPKTVESVVAGRPVVVENRTPTPVDDTSYQATQPATVAQQQQTPSTQPAATQPPARTTLPVVSAFDPGIRYRVQIMATAEAPLEDRAQIFGELREKVHYLILEILLNVDVRFPNYYHYVTPAYITHAEAAAVRDRIRKYAEEEIMKVVKNRTAYNGLMEFSRLRRHEEFNILIKSFTTDETEIDRIKELCDIGNCFIATFEGGRRVAIQMQ
jgi:tetratricopeptide (TPR) repeat protein